MSQPPSLARCRPSLPEFLATPRTIRHFTPAKGQSSLATLEAVVEGIVAHRIPRTPILIGGPAGCGKRTLARAIARDLAGDVVELEPTSLCSDHETRHMLLGLRDGDTLLLHNIDEFPKSAQWLILHAVMFGALRPLAAAPTHPGDCPARPDEPKRLAAFHAVATTDLQTGVQLRRYASFLHFSLARSEEGSAASVIRALRANRLGCTKDAARVLSAFLCAAQSDMFPALITIATSHALQADATTVDEPMARDLVTAAWEFMPVGEAAESAKRHARLWECPLPEAAARLGIPAHMSEQLGRPAKKDAIDLQLLYNPAEESEEEE
jgi:DNA polymerase III delta prime subunit